MKMVLDKMRFIYVFLLLIFSSCSMNMDRVTVDSPEIGYEGRYFMTDSGSVRYDYPGFRIKASFTRRFPLMTQAIRFFAKLKIIYLFHLRYALSL